MNIFSLYATSFYYTMQTITTVGYGDIGITTSTERAFCIVIQLIGVVAFSFTSGSLTNIIANYDHQEARNAEKLSVLNKIFKKYHLPSELYYQLKTQIQNVDDAQEVKDLNDFLDELPFRLKIRTITNLYKKQYLKINYLSSMSESFLGWICPLLRQHYVPVDQYIYYDSDIIDHIYFLTQGLVGFVIPFRGNLVYLEVDNGDTFGE